MDDLINHSKKKFLMSELEILSDDNFKLELLLKMIDDLINSYKLDYLKEWEKDHNIKRDVLDKQISSLTSKKKEITDLFKNKKGFIKINLNVQCN